MKIGLYDVSCSDYPNLALMKISAYHKSIGDNVEFITDGFTRYDKAYISKIFGDEYCKFDTFINANIICYGGTGFAIEIVDGKEKYIHKNDNPLPEYIEHIYPDYSLYDCKDTAYGFLTRGCPNNCDFCIVSKKEGLKSYKVADLSEFWNGQKYIKLLDPNILACKNHMELLQQLADSGAWVDFTQGLDARFINSENAELLSKIKIKIVHFAFDFYKNKDKIIKGLRIFKEYTKISSRKAIIYMLTNFDTTIEQDLERVKLIINEGYIPDVRIYRKNSLPHPHILRDLQRWCNNKIIFRSCDFENYVPRSDGKRICEIYEQ